MKTCCFVYTRPQSELGELWRSPLTLTVQSTVDNGNASIFDTQSSHNYQCHIDGSEGNSILFFFCLGINDFFSYSALFDRSTVTE